MPTPRKPTKSKLGTTAKGPAGKDRGAARAAGGARPALPSPAVVIPRKVLALFDAAEKGVPAAFAVALRALDAATLGQLLEALPWDAEPGMRLAKRLAKSPLPEYKDFAQAIVKGTPPPPPTFVKCCCDPTCADDCLDLVKCFGLWCRCCCHCWPPIKFPFCCFRAAVRVYPKDGVADQYICASSLRFAGQAAVTAGDNIHQARITVTAASGATQLAGLTDVAGAAAGADKLLVGNADGKWHGDTHAIGSAADNATLWTGLTVQSGLNGKADAAHTHAGYAPISHAHSEYALTSHTHSEYAATSHAHSEYALTSHTHSEYAATSHTHSGYAPTAHTHAMGELSGFTAAAAAAGKLLVGNADGKWHGDTHAVGSAADNATLWTGLTIQSGLNGKADTAHTHAGYAPTSHTHSEYALTSHTHSEYAATSHTHSEYAATSHTHSGFAPTSHNHAMGELDGFAAAAAGAGKLLVGNADGKWHGDTHSIGAAADGQTLWTGATIKAGLDGKADQSALANIACSGTKQATFGLEVVAGNPKLVVAIAHVGFKGLTEGQVVATASAYVVTGASPAYAPLRTAARAWVDAGSLKLDLVFDATECTTYDSKQLVVAYTVARNNDA